MNHIYRLVWSASHRMLVAVSEIAGYRRGGGRSGIVGGVTTARRLPTTGAMTTGQAIRYALYASVFFAPAAFAAGLPTGGQVTAGQATIQQAGNQLTVTQSSSKAILNWQSFSIGSGDTVNFQQPDAASVALNNVTGSDPSAIFGHLHANGQVFLVNPNGITFAPGAQVNVGGIIASTLPITRANFLKGNYTFSGNSTAAVNNAGTLSAASGGYIAFIGHQVNNTGSLIAPGGTVALGAGSLVDLTLQGNSLVHFAVSQSALQALAENGGLIEANGGTVMLSAEAKNALMQTVVNNTGEIEAETVGTKDGHIALLGGKSGKVAVGGTLDASAPNGGDGGQIDTSGAYVQVSSNATVTTRATDGNSGNWTIDPSSYTISSNASASSTNSITPTNLEDKLKTTSITLSATSNTSGSGNINVDAPVTWSANSLILEAYNDIVVNQPLTASGTAGLELQYGQGSTNGRINGTAASVTLNAPINLGSSSSFSTQFGSKGTLTTYTIVDSQSALHNINNGLGGDYALGSNLSLTGDFSPIGNLSSPFTGTFDGLGHTLAGLTIDSSSNNDVGLFGVNKGSIENVGLTGVSVVGTAYVGGLVGFNANDGSITEAYATGSVSGSSNSVGGLVGYNHGGITEAYATGSVSGSNAGGLVGLNSNGSITEAYATGSVSGSKDVGGLVGLNSNSSSNGSSITDGYWDTTTSGTKGIGGGSTNGATGLSNTQMQQSSNFSGLGLSSATTSNSTWIIYNGHTTPLLKAFMTPLTVTVNNNHPASATYTGRTISLSDVNATYSVNGGTATTTAPTSNFYGGNTPYGSNAVNVGTYDYQSGSLWSDQQGYIITADVGTLDVTPVTLTASISGTPTKTYDGNTAATLTSTDYSLSGFVSGQGATVTQTVGTYAGSNAGTEGVSATLASGDFSAGSGTSLSNYVLPSTATGTGSIDQAVLTASISGTPTKTYDGNTAATLTSTDYSLSGFVSGQGATVTQTVGTYATANVGIDIPVTAKVSTSDLRTSTGTLLSNYVLSSTIAAGTGIILPTQQLGLGVVSRFIQQGKVGYSVILPNNASALSQVPKAPQLQISRHAVNTGDTNGVVCSTNKGCLSDPSGPAA